MIDIKKRGLVGDGAIKHEKLMEEKRRDEIFEGEVTEIEKIIEDYLNDAVVTQNTGLSVLQILSVPIKTISKKLATALSDKVIEKSEVLNMFKKLLTHLHNDTSPFDLRIMVCDYMKKLEGK